MSETLNRAVAFLDAAIADLDTATRPVPDPSVLDRARPGRTRRPDDRDCAPGGMNVVAQGSGRDETTLGSKSDPATRGAKKIDGSTFRRHRRATHTMIRLIVWQLPERAYPSNHPRLVTPRASRRTRLTEPARPADPPSDGVVPRSLVTVARHRRCVSSQQVTSGSAVH